MFKNMSFDEIRSECRNSIESLEKWARFLIDNELKRHYGENYFNCKIDEENYLIKKEIREKAQEMMHNSQNHFNNELDTLFLKEIIYILCRKDLYNNCFSVCLRIMYPDGKEEAKTFLNRILLIRDKLSHSNPISIREAEQAICYANDFVEGVKKYLNIINKENKFSVPSIIRMNDSLGNEFYFKNEKSYECIQLLNNNQPVEFNCGDTYIIELTTDPSFEDKDFEIKYRCGKDVVIMPTGEKKIVIQFSEKDVSQNTILEIELKSKKRWHKYSFCDQRILINFIVIPPQ